MSGIFGVLNLNDTDRVFAATNGQQVIYDLIREHLLLVNSEMDRLMNIFVRGTTTDHKWRYKLPGGGYLQERAFEGQSRVAAVKATGEYDVAFPLKDFGADISASDVVMAYMTLSDLDRHVSNVMEQNTRTVRRELLLALFDNTQDSVDDPLWGTLLVEPLANDDSVVYPPVVGSGTEATEDHYLESSYTAANISDTNNPYVTIEAELTHHYGFTQGNDPIAVFIHGDQVAKTEDLTDFVGVPDQFIVEGTQTAIPSPLPVGHPGRVIGRTNGCWVIQWNWIPTGYLLGIHMDIEQPLYKREDPADTGLGSGFQLVATDDTFPWESSIWRHRFGFGAANRLNGVAMELGTGGTYTIPTLA